MGSRGKRRRGARSAAQADGNVRPWIGPAAVVAVLVVAGLLPYHNSFEGQFVYDDVPSIVENPTIETFSPPWAPLSPPEDTTVGGRPVLNLSFAVNHALGGLDVRVYHATNLAIHVLASLFLFGVLRATFRSPRLVERFGAHAGGLALACALLWLVHPLQTASVSFVAQRAESMTGMFYLASLWAAIRGFGSTRPWPWYAGSIAAALLALGCKELAATIPVLLLAWDLVFSGDGIREIVKKRWWLYAGLLATWPLVVVVLASGARASVGFDLDVSVWQYLTTQARVIPGAYLGLAFWPHPLVFNYGWPIPDSPLEWVPGAALILALLALTAFALRRWPAAGYAGVWFFLILAPTSSVIPVAREMAAEHRMYLPLAGIVALLVALAYHWGRVLVDRTPGDERRRRLVALVAGWATVLALAVTLGAVTARRNVDYRTPLAIWTSSIRADPDNPRAWTNRCAVLALDGRYREAIDDCTNAVGRFPPMPEAHANRGMAYALTGRPERALEDYEKAIELDPGRGAWRYYRGALLADRGEHRLAVEDFTAAIEDDPAHAAAWRMRGDSYRLLGEEDLALEDLDRAIGLDPSDDQALNVRGMIRAARGQDSGALQDFSNAIKLDPGNPDYHLNRARLYQKLDALEPAIGDLRAVIEADPERKGVPRTLARLLARLDDPGRAVEIASATVASTGHRDFTVIVTLAEQWTEIGRTDDARDVLLEGARIAAQAGRKEVAYELRAAAASLGSG